MDNSRKSSVRRELQVGDRVMTCKKWLDSYSAGVDKVLLARWARLIGEITHVGDHTYTVYWHENGNSSVFIKDYIVPAGHHSVPPEQLNEE